LNLECNELVSNFAFNFNLRRYNEDFAANAEFFQAIFEIGRRHKVGRCRLTRGCPRSVSEIVFKVLKRWFQRLC